MEQTILEVKTDTGIRRLQLTGNPVTIGRDTANSLTFRDDKLSRFHCVVEKKGAAFRLRDLGSSNGTKVNGKNIRLATLKTGDVICLGQVEIKFLVRQTSTRHTTKDTGDGNQASLPMTVQPDKNSPHPSSRDMAVNSDGSQAVTLDEGDANLSQSAVRGPDLPPPTGTGTAGQAEQLPPSDDMHGLIIAAQSHEKILQKMLASLPGESIDVSEMGLINSHGQTVHAPTDDNVRAAVHAGRDGVLFLRTFLLLCMRIRATDLHIEPKDQSFQVRMRVDGMMVSTLDMQRKIAQRVLRLVKVLCEIDISQTQSMQDGHFCTDIAGRRIDYRVSFTPAMYGQKLVIRILDQAQSPTRLKDLNLPSWMEADVGRVVRQNSGMVLMCGPTGSGKTTTLYTLIREIDVEVRNIITIEDPVEYQIDGVTQIPINESQGNSFSNLLRSVLRQDPDVILVGEIRDTETAKIAMQAAITGHLVFSTVHAQDGVSTIFRLLDLGIEPYLAASGLNLVLAQRLVRTLCPNCKKANKLKPVQAMRLSKFGIEDINVVYTPMGCPRCLKTGYIGRRGIFELLNVTDDLRDVILSTSQIQDMRKTIRASLFTSLHETGYRLVAEGQTAMEEIDRVVGGE